MSADPKSVSLKGWQWALVLALAMIAGAVGAVFTGGVQVTIVENYGDAPLRPGFTVDEDD